MGTLDPCNCLELYPKVFKSLNCISNLIIMSWTGHLSWPRSLQLVALNESRKHFKKEKHIVRSVLYILV